MKESERGTPSWPTNLLYSRWRRSLYEISQETRSTTKESLYPAFMDSRSGVVALVDTEKVADLAGEVGTGEKEWADLG